MPSNYNEKTTCHIGDHEMQAENIIRHMKKDRIQEANKQDLNNLSDKRDKICDIGQNSDAQCKSNDDLLPQSDEDGDIIERYAWIASRVNRNHHFLRPRNIRANLCE